MNIEEKENLKQVIHEQTLSQIETLGAHTNKTDNLERNIYRLAEIENERYIRVK